MKISLRFFSHQMHIFNYHNIKKKKKKWKYHVIISVCTSMFNLLIVIKTEGNVDTKMQK
jgi:hypothetical protein